MLDIDTSDRGSRPLHGVRVLRARTIRLVSAGSAFLLLASGALASQASAAGLLANKPCYVNVDPSKGAPMTVGGAGFPGSSTVTLSGGTVFKQALTSPTGTFVLTTPAPELPTIFPASKSTTLTATAYDVNGNPTSATIAVKSANLAIETQPSKVKNIRKDKVTFTFSGFKPGKNIYGFYARRKIIAKSNFGKAKGACGVQRKRALLFPGGRPKSDQYKVTFESQKRYSKRASPRVTGTLNIFQF
jgi:hypothetical protein